MKDVLTIVMVRDYAIPRRDPVTGRRRVKLAGEGDELDIEADGLDVDTVCRLLNQELATPGLTEEETPRGTGPVDEAARVDESARDESAAERRAS